MSNKITNNIIKGLERSFSNFFLSFLLFRVHQKFINQNWNKLNFGIFIEKFSLVEFMNFSECEILNLNLEDLFGHFFE